VLKCFLRELNVKLGRRDEMATLRTAARKITQKSPNDVVVLAAARSPVTRAFKGGFKDAFP
jgi:acetyl-CoA acyltransferase 1